MRLIKLATAVLALATVSGVAGAATYEGAYSGNDPFPNNLVIPAGQTNSNIDIDSPGLAKCDSGWSLGLQCSNWLDGNADGNYATTPAFSLTYTDTMSGINGQGFDWTFTPGDVVGEPDPDYPSFIAVKAGPNYYVWSLSVGEQLGGSIDYGALGVRQGISHVTFYDTAGSPMPDVPIPAAMWLLAGGLGALGSLRARRKA